VGPAGSRTSQLDLTPGHKVSLRPCFFLYNYFVTGEDDKAISSTPGATPMKNRMLYCNSASVLPVQISDSSGGINGTE
jgi:hypothetical protein